MTDECRNCNNQIHYDNGAWCDNSGGDVCGIDGENSPHRPHEYRTSLEDFSPEEANEARNHVVSIMFNDIMKKNGMS